MELLVTVLLGILFGGTGITALVLRAIAWLDKRKNGE